MDAESVGATLIATVIELWAGLNDAVSFGAFIRAGILLTVGFSIVKLVDSLFGIGLAVSKRMKKEDSGE